jgi:hypothetical protein
MTDTSTVTYVAAKSSSSFTNSIGVGAKFDPYATAGYSNTTTILNELKTLGITNVRDGTPTSSQLPMFETLAKAGVHFDLLESSVYVASGKVNATYDVTGDHALQAAVPGSVTSIEGTNEYTTNSYTLNGVSSSGNLSWGLSDASQLQTAARADSLFANTTLVSPSAVQLNSLPNFSSYVNASNAHVYVGPGQQLQNAINQGVAYAQASAPGKPVYITETGVSSAGYGSSSESTADLQTQAIIDTNAVLDGFASGAAMTYLYELSDWSGGYDAVEKAFGLFYSDGTAKPAATAIGNLMHILADSSSGSVATSGLSYGISGLPSTASSTLLEKSDGTFDIVLWNGKATVSNGSSDVTPATSNVTVNFGTNESSIAIYDPMKGATATQTVTNASSVTVGLSADPIIIELQPGSSASTGSTGSTGSTSSTTTSSSAIVPSVSDATLSGAQATITGHAQAGSTVTVSDGSTTLGSVVADSSGNWSMTATVLSAAQHHLTEVATLSGTTTSSAGTASFGSYNQALTGSTGNDVLIGMNGDKLTGAGGSDTFVINYNTGKQTIQDFSASNDTIAIDHREFANYTSMMSHAVQSGSDVLITFNQWNVITLHNTDIHSLTSSNFTYF